MKKKIALAEYDAELDTGVADSRTNMVLTLILRVKFTPLDISNAAPDGMYPDSNNELKRVIAWDMNQWMQWKQGFIRSAEAFWSDRFCLVNPSHLFAIDEQCKYFVPNVRCRLKIQDQGDCETGEHIQVTIARLSAFESGFRSHSRLMTQRDTTLERAAYGKWLKSIKQRTHVHEVGHWLGLDHVNVGKRCCPEILGKNRRPCYGITDFELNSVMGGGMDVRPENAKPWQRAMRYFAAREPEKHLLAPASDMDRALAVIKTGPKPSYPPSAIPWTAEMKKVFPRTPQEVVDGALPTYPRY